jgi:flavin reductase (DIM6/NTAB) family NADH-FMN oxidoreductase RutF
MKNLFETIPPEDIEDNLFKLIGQDWMLICAGKPGHYNMMTASWGCAGVLWRKHVAVVFVRPQRHTFLFLEENPRFTLNFFDESHRETLNTCGTKSGRTIDKMQLPGLRAIETPSGSLAFEQSRLVLECRKIYYDDIKPEFFMSFDLEKIYSQKDYHRFFIGEITQVYKRK